MVPPHPLCTALPEGVREAGRSGGGTGVAGKDGAPSTGAGNAGGASQSVTGGGGMPISPMPNMSAPSATKGAKTFAEAASDERSAAANRSPPASWVHL